MVNKDEYIPDMRMTTGEAIQAGLLPSDILNDVAAGQAAPAPQKDYLQIALSKKVSQTEQVPRPETVLFLAHTDNQYRLLNKGSISTLSGKAKVGKTTVMALLIADAIKSGLRVLWIDTEQGAYYANTTQFYLLQVAGITICDNLEMYDFREFGPTERIELTEALLNEYVYDLVVVDGVRDYVFDINSPEEATNITTKLMKWSVDKNCHVAMLIHENKQGGELRGHLGTECENKSEVILSLSQSTDNPPITIIKCKAVRGRAKFDDFFVRRDENGLPYVDLSINSGSVTQIGSDSKPKRVAAMEPREYPVSFLNDLVIKALVCHKTKKGRNYEFPKAGDFISDLRECWPSIWKEYYSDGDMSGSKSTIAETPAKLLKKHLVDSQYVIEEPGKQPNSVIIKMHPESVF